MTSIIIVGSQHLRAQNLNHKQPVRTIIVFFDGLRSDYIVPEIMPNLHSLKMEGTYNSAHHSIYPTFTRVNSAGYATGSYPGTNGLMGNEVYFPGVEKTRSLNTANIEILEKLMRHTSGDLLTSASFGEVLKKAGHRLMVFSDGSVGQAFFQNHKINDGAIVNTDYIVPESIREALFQKIGPPPAFEELNKPRHTWITDALLDYVFAEDGPLVSAIWYADPDETAHMHGIGSPLTLQAIKNVDEQFGRIVQAIKSNNKEQEFNIIISTDHGFVTLEGETDLEDFLISKGIKKSKQSDDVVLADGAIFVNRSDTSLITSIVQLLQQQQWAGPIFTRGIKKGSLYGWVEGTLSFESIHWEHSERSADILFAYHWDDKKNTFGYPGNSYSKGWTGSHGGISSYEINIGLIASGPSFKKKYKGMLPSSNVDIVPTVLHLYHIEPPGSMDGRVLHELLVDDTHRIKQKPKKETIRASTKYKGGSYTVELERSVLGKYKYVNFGKVKRD